MRNASPAGRDVGIDVGWCVGLDVGIEVGLCVGLAVGVDVGRKDGSLVGTGVGAGDGAAKPSHVMNRELSRSAISVLAPVPLVVPL